mgnify:CR=1 FL=1
MQMLTPEQVEHTSLLVNNLSAAQKVWISGYLHGMSMQSENLSLESFSLSEPVAETPVVQKSITVLYGSQTGNSRKIAEKLVPALEAQGHQVNLLNMLNYRSSQLKKETHLLALISTHGNGEPPDEALGFFKFINGNKAPKLNGLNFSVLALGDSSYDEFCQTGYELDARLAELGAVRYSDVVACDVDYADDAESWQETLLALLKPSDDQQVVSQINAPAATNSDVLYDERNPFKAEVLENLVLTDDGSDKSVLHVELSLEESGLHYEPGDVVTIEALNDSMLVDSIIKELALSETTEVAIKKSSLTLKDALLKKRELTHITRKQLQNYADISNNAELLAQAQDKSQLLEEIQAADVLDVLQLWPAKLDAQQLIDWLRPMSARQYSIASSEKASEEEIHVLVKQVEYEYRGRTHNGVCSTGLAQAEVGDELGISIKPNTNFKLPQNPETKIIMIGAGTGVAPFRSFLFEREFEETVGNSWLFFGEQRFQTDFLYQTEWQQFLKTGVLEKMDVAFSRDQEEKIYVQDRILEQAKSVYEWLESGAHLYVCGDMNHMAKDVHQTLITVIEQQSDRTLEEASDWLDQLIAEKRYQRDIY